MTIAQILRRIGDGDDSGFTDLINVSGQNGLSDEELACVTLALARSGATIPLNDAAADIASTGGPGSLSTLLCPLHFRSIGLVVSKLAVQGRPAGGIDVLQTVPGYRASLSLQEATAALARSGYIHLLADQTWAPDDARLFAARQQQDAQNDPALVIASLLAKKLAAGTVNAGLEVRVANHGNFGTSISEARTNAIRYNVIGELVGLNPACILTDGRGPYQPYIGRGEALIALDDVLNDRAEPWLAAHNLLCLRMVHDIARSSANSEVLPPHGALRDSHADMLVAHGTDVARFDERVETVRASRRSDVRSTDDGSVEIDMARLRALLSERQREAAATGSEEVADPAGVIMAVQPRAKVKRGDRLLSVRVPDGEDRLAGDLAACVRVIGSPRRVNDDEIPYEVVRA